MTLNTAGDVRRCDGAADSGCSAGWGVSVTSARGSARRMSLQAQRFKLHKRHLERQRTPRDLEKPALGKRAHLPASHDKMIDELHINQGQSGLEGLRQQLIRPTRLRCA